MMLIGTSLGGCLKSIAKGEVSEDDVLLIITRTDCKTIDNLFKVVETYYNGGNGFAMMPTNYDYTDLDLNELQELALKLWEGGKLHQPRSYGYGTHFIHPDMSRDNLWLEVSPIGLNTNPIVVEAYEKYKMLDVLTRNE